MSSRAVSLLVALCLAVSLPVFAQMHDHHEHPFDNAEQWAKSFDDPARDAWQKPDEVIRALALPSDASVVDIGSGTGYFAARLARAVPRGRVLGVDLSRDMVRYLNERAKREGLANLASQAGAPDDPRLLGPVDLVILVDTYHHIGARERYFRRVRDALKPGGRLAIIDFRLDAPMGPPPESRIAPERVKQELARAGFAIDAEYDFLPRQYFLVLRRGAK